MAYRGGMDSDSCKGSFMGGAGQFGVNRVLNIDRR